MSGRRTPFPQAAPPWLIGPGRARVLDLGSGSGGFAVMIQALGHEVFCLDRSVQAIADLPESLRSFRHVAGQVESLPYLSCHFDVVTAAQTLHRFAPGLALTEIARVLRPGGHLAIAYNTRDDTVPWVKRLIALMHRSDPAAMRGEFGDDSVNAVLDSPYFTQVERRNFRNWVPITRSGLIAMVERRDSVARLDPETRRGLLAEVGELYDNSARAPEPLLLPFQTSCWRAVVDHSSLVVDDDLDDVLQIKL